MGFAASQSTDGGLSKRVFGSLLNWMQERTAQIWCVATANDLSALPPEPLRRGPFDEIFFVDLPDAAARDDIFAVHLKRRRRDPAAFDLAALAAASEGFSGAGIEQAIVSGPYAAFGPSRNLTTDLIRTGFAAGLGGDGRCVVADGENGEPDRIGGRRSQFVVRDAARIR